MPYEKVHEIWENAPSTATPITAEALMQMEEGIATAQETAEAGGGTGGGDDAREIQMQASSTHLQWRYVGDTTWNNLIAIADLKGEPGDPGGPGDPTTVEDGAIAQAKVNGLVDALADRPVAVNDTVTGIWQGTQAQYNAIGTKNATTVYIIKAG